MSTHEPRNPHLRLESDVVSMPFLMTLTVAAVLITLGGIGWAWLIFEQETRRLGGLENPVVTPMAPRAISGVNQTLIHYERHGQKLEAQQRLVLDQYGWVDRSAGIVRIPIDEAIRIKARELAP